MSITSLSPISRPARGGRRIWSPLCIPPLILTTRKLSRGCHSTRARKPPPCPFFSLLPHEDLSVPPLAPWPQSVLPRALLPGHSYLGNAGRPPSSLCFLRIIPQESMSPTALNSGKRDGARHTHMLLLFLLPQLYKNAKESKENRTLSQQCLRAQKELEGVSSCLASLTCFVGPCGVTKESEALALGIQFQREP